MTYRFLVFVFLSAVGIQSAFSQTQFSSGLLAGFSATQVDGDGVSGFNKAGLTGGAFVQFGLSNQLSGRIEMTYVGKGSRKPADPDNGDFSSWGYTFHYIDVPLLVEYELDNFRLQGGPYASVLISGSQFQDGASYDVVNPEMRPYDFGVAIGASYDLGETLFLQARYTNSVVAIRPPPDPGNQTRWFDGGMSNIVIQFTVGLRILS